MSRISRKQMKRNEMAEAVGSAVDYTRSHSRNLLYAVIAAGFVQQSARMLRMEVSGAVRSGGSPARGRHRRRGKKDP